MWFCLCVGMDPATKRNLWNVIIQSRDGGKSIILTSHSMEECEALCTRITVFVNGQSKCLGSSQHLKSKFCKGFELKIKVKQDEEMQRYGTQLNALHMNLLIYRKCLNYYFSLNMIEVKNFILQMFNGAIFRYAISTVESFSIELIEYFVTFFFIVLQQRGIPRHLDIFSAHGQHSMVIYIWYYGECQEVAENWRLFN